MRGHQADQRGNNMYGGENPQRRKVVRASLRERSDLDFDFATALPTAFFPTGVLTVEQSSNSTHTFFPVL
jgi:hypothetical protein